MGITGFVFNAGERVSAANSNATEPPAIAVPEALTLPIAAIGVSRDIGRAAVISIAGPVVARSIAGSIPIAIGTGRDRAADNGTADDPASNSGAETALGMGGRRGRNGKGGYGGQCHQCFPHGITFLMEQDSGQSGLSLQKFHISLERSMNAVATFGDK